MGIFAYFRWAIAPRVPTPIGIVLPTIGTHPRKFTDRSIRCMEPPLPDAHPSTFPYSSANIARSVSRQPSSLLKGTVAYLEVNGRIGALPTVYPFALFPAAGGNDVGSLVALGLAALVLAVATRGRLGYARAGDGSVRVPGDEPAGASRAGLADGATPPGRTAG